MPKSALGSGRNPAHLDRTASMTASPIPTEMVVPFLSHSFTAPVSHCPGYQEFERSRAGRRRRDGPARARPRPASARRCSCPGRTSREAGYRAIGALANVGKECVQLGPGLTFPATDLTKGVGRGLLRRAARSHGAHFDRQFLINLDEHRVQGKRLGHLASLAGAQPFPDVIRRAITSISAGSRKAAYPTAESGFRQ
jgi:hypothetical protein